MAEKEDYEKVRFDLSGDDLKKMKTIGDAGVVTVKLAIPANYRWLSYVFLKLPNGLGLDKGSQGEKRVEAIKKEGEIITGAVDPTAGFTGVYLVPTGGDGRIAPWPKWEESDIKDPSVLAKLVPNDAEGGKIGGEDDVSVELDLGWTVPVKVTGSIATGAKIEACIIDARFRDYHAEEEGGSPKTITESLTVLGVAGPKAPEITAVGLAVTGSHKNGDVWWVKDAAAALKLELTAKDALQDPIYLRWHDGKTWHNLVAAGTIDQTNKKKVTFDLKGEKALTDPLGKHTKVDLKFALALRADVPPATVPGNPVSLSLQQEQSTIGVTIGATFDSSGKLILSVDDGGTSGVKSLQYSVDDRKTWKEAGAITGGKTTAFDAGKEFRNGISVKATSNLDNVSGEAEAKIDPKDIFEVTWPNYTNAVVGVPLTFDVKVVVKYNFLMPIEHASVTLPKGMQVAGKNTIEKAPTTNELGEPSIAITGNVTVNGSPGQTIEQARLKLTSLHFSKAFELTDPAVDRGKFRAIPEIATNGLSVTGGHNDGSIWWVKDTSALKLEVTAKDALQDPIYLRWYDGTKWHNLAAKGVIDAQGKKKVTFDLKGESALTMLLGDNGKHELKFALALTASEAAEAVPAHSVPLSLAQEVAGFVPKAIVATFDDSGKLILSVDDGGMSGVKSLQYSVDDRKTWKEAGAITGGKTTAFDAGKEFRNGISVKATSNLDNVSGEAEAKIDPKDIFEVTWPNYTNAVVGVPLTFDVKVVAKYTLLLPIEHATVSLPKGMKAETSADFDRAPTADELGMPPIAIKGKVSVSGPAETVIEKAILKLTSKHFKDTASITDSVNSGKYQAKPTTKLTIDDNSVTNSERPFVTGTFTPAPTAGKLLSFQYKTTDVKWVDVPIGDVLLGKNGVFRVKLPPTLVKANKISGLLLRAKGGEHSLNDADYTQSQKAVDIQIDDSKPVIDKAEFKRDLGTGDLIATVTVHGPVGRESVNPIDNVHITLHGEAMDPLLWTKEAGWKQAGDNVWAFTVKVPAGNAAGAFHPVVHAVTKAGVEDSKPIVFQGATDAVEVTFKLDGQDAKDGVFEKVTAGDHKLEITILPRFNLAGYKLDGYFGTKAAHDNELQNKAVPTISPATLTGLDLRALNTWNGRTSLHVLTIKDVPQPDTHGKPQSFTLAIPMSIAAGKAEHQFEIHISDLGTTTHGVFQKEGVYTVTFRMKP